MGAILVVKVSSQSHLFGSWFSNITVVNTFYFFLEFFTLRALLFELIDFFPKLEVFRAKLFLQETSKVSLALWKSKIVKALNDWFPNENSRFSTCMLLCLNSYNLDERKDSLSMYQKIQLVKRFKIKIFQKNTKMFINPMLTKYWKKDRLIDNLLHLLGSSNTFSSFSRHFLHCSALGLKDS